jgi:hypothetical protein
MTARDVLSAIRTYGDESTLPPRRRAPLYELIDRAEAQAMGPCRPSRCGSSRRAPASRPPSAPGGQRATARRPPPVAALPGKSPA